MSVKEHYDHHLGNFYSWMLGEFEVKQAEQADFFESRHIFPPDSATIAIDLGAGSGVQSVPLARLGFSVIAVDFNKQLLNELNSNGKEMDITSIEADITDFSKYEHYQAGLIVCMGDTLTHLPSRDEIRQLISKISEILIEKGKLVLSFRDLSFDLVNEQRFIPVKSDENRILTCFLEYFPNHVNVYDILHEKREGKWIQKISSYPKVRVSASDVEGMLVSAGLNILSVEVINRMVYIIAQK